MTVVKRKEFLFMFSIFPQNLPVAMKMTKEAVKKRINIFLFGLQYFHTATSKSILHNIEAYLIA